MRNTMKNFISGKLSRLAKLSTSLMRAGSQYAVDTLVEKASSKIEDAQKTAKQIKAAQEIIKSMGELKGAVMKIGQMISVTDDLLLPPEVTQMFKTLQKESPSMSKQQVQRVFVENFGKLPENIFAEFDYIPVAAASIGQVHRGITKEGDRVAIKVQYPEIANAIKNDLSNIDQIQKVFKLILPKGMDIRHFLEELRDSFLHECDYENEMRNMQKFEEALATEFPQIRIPKTFPQYTKKQVLTTEFVEGDTFEQSLKYSQEEKDELGRLLYESFLFLLFRKRMLHTDPQNGNYLFRKNEIILLDFGSIREFSEDFVKCWERLCWAVETDNFELYKECCMELQFGHEKTSQDFMQAHFNLASGIYEPFLNEGTYSVTGVNPLELIKNFVIQAKWKDVNMPQREFMMLDRANIGLFTKIIQWKSHVNWANGRLKYQRPL